MYMDVVMRKRKMVMVMVKMEVRFEISGGGKRVEIT